MSFLFEDLFTASSSQAWQTPFRAVRTLLANAADIAIGDELAVTETMLEAGATCECEAHGLHEHVTVQWVLQQARYQIARTLTDLPTRTTRSRHRSRPGHPDHHPPQIQARVLHRAAERTANELDDC